MPFTKKAGVPLTPTARAAFMSADLDVSHEIALIEVVPEQVRGFDDIKERNLREAREKEAELLTAYRLRTSPEGTVPVA